MIFSKKWCYAGIILGYAISLHAESMQPQPPSKGSTSQNKKEEAWERSFILRRPKWVISNEKARTLAMTVETETDAAQLQKMENALRIYHQFTRDASRYEIEQHYRLLFTDPDYRMLVTREMEGWLDLRKKYSPDRSAIILINRAFLEWQTAAEIQDYESQRDAYSLALFGEKLDDKAFYTAVGKKFDAALNVAPVLDSAGHITSIRKSPILRWWQTPADTAAYGKALTDAARKARSDESTSKIIEPSQPPARDQLTQWENNLHLTRPKNLISDAEGQKLLLQFDPSDESAPKRLVSWQRYQDAALLYEQDQHLRMLYSDSAYRNHILKINGSWSIIRRSSSPETAMHTALNRSLLSSLSNKEPNELPDNALINFGRQILDMEKVTPDALFQKIASDFDRAVRWHVTFDSTGNIVQKHDLNLLRAWDEKKLMEAVSQDVLNPVDAPKQW
ncbi:MAG: hypothetical protein ABIP97_12120 [Chthoniobacterales bacterium]